MVVVLFRDPVWLPAYFAYFVVSNFAMHHFVFVIRIFHLSASGEVK